MASTPTTRRAAESALTTHVGIAGGAENDRETQITDLITDLLLLLPDDETADQVTDSAYQYASEDRSGV